jgi:hypothetical protein
MKRAARVAGVALLLAVGALPRVDAAELGSYTARLPIGDWRPTRDQAPHWRERLVVVMDGGACFFRAEVDADSGAIVAFNVNGEA